MKNTFKKTLISSLIIVSLSFFTACQKNAVTLTPKTEHQPWYNLPVEKEPFEDMDIVNSLTTHITFNSESEIYDDSELVFIGMPVDTFTEGKQYYFNLNGENVSPDSGDFITGRITIRNVKIVEMIKGDYPSDIIKIADRGVTKTYDTGKTQIIDVPSGSSIEKKNVKYIFYVTKSGVPENDYYYPRLDDGVINIDMLHPEMNNTVSVQRLNQVKERFASQFKKYDRSAELVKAEK